MINHIILFRQARNITLHSFFLLWKKKMYALSEQLNFRMQLNCYFHGWKKKCWRYWVCFVYESKCDEIGISQSNRFQFQNHWNHNTRFVDLCSVFCFVLPFCVLLLFEVKWVCEFLLNNQLLCPFFQQGRKWWSATIIFYQSKKKITLKIPSGPILWVWCIHVSYTYLMVIFKAVWPWPAMFFSSFV